jgi:hypothetical protein
MNRPPTPGLPTYIEPYGTPYESGRTTADFYWWLQLGAYFCRISYAKRGVCTYVHKSLNLENIDLETYCIEKYFEVCALELDLNFTRTCIITIYSAPSGNFNLFINKLDTILRKLYNPTLDTLSVVI